MKALPTDVKRSAQDIDLRRRALERMEGQDAATFDGNRERMLHELQVYQVELEMQNEQLEAARAWIEAALASYTELFDFAPVPYFTLDATGTIIDINLTGARLLGAERARLLDKRLGNYIAMADRRYFAACLKTVFNTHAEARCEIELEAKDGSRRVVEVRATSANNGESCRAVLIDVTERSRRERQLAQLSETFTLAREGMYLANADGRIVTVNHALADLTGYQVAQLEGQAESLLRSAGPDAGADGAMLHAMLFKGSWSGEMALRHRDGSAIAVHQQTSTMIDGTGATLRMVRCAPLAPTSASTAG